MNKKKLQNILKFSSIFQPVERSLWWGWNKKKEKFTYKSDDLSQPLEAMNHVEVYVNFLASQEQKFCQENKTSTRAYRHKFLKFHFEQKTESIDRKEKSSFDVAKNLKLNNFTHLSSITWDFNGILNVNNDASWTKYFFVLIKRSIMEL
jgi:hypothetical protein